jgi:hypothetical protein
MRCSSVADRIGVLGGFNLMFWVGVALIFGTGMLQHWHQSQPLIGGARGRIIFDITLSLGVICQLPTFYRRALRKKRLAGAGGAVEVEFDERLGQIQGQAALFAVAVMLLVLGLFPMYQGLLRSVSTESLSSAAVLVLLASWIGRALWLNRD